MIVVAVSLVSRHNIRVIGSGHNEVVKRVRGIERAGRTLAGQKR